MKLTVEEIYNKLINDDKILTKKGRITFSLGDINIIVRQRDVVGNIMQEWIEGWLKKNGIEYALNENTQMPPDFYLNPENKTEELMEIKAFNYKAGPGFDIADFRMYEQEISQKPWMLNVTYLIFGYEMSDEGVVTIKKIWKNKVWEMSRPMRSGTKKTIWPINLQIKKGLFIKLGQQNGMENHLNFLYLNVKKIFCLQWKKLYIRTKILVMMVLNGFQQSLKITRNIMV